jgi:hypothetical protein
MSAPFDAAVLGMTTIPVVSPGEPVYHLGRLDDGTKKLERILSRLPEGHPHEEMVDDLASSMLVVAPPKRSGPAERKPLEGRPDQGSK